VRRPGPRPAAHVEGKDGGEVLMPLYEYVCRACGSRTEVRHTIAEARPSRCVACGGVLERVFTPPSGPRRRWSPWATNDPSAPAKVP
jgi:putative FmdB family regulatory protein